MLQTWYGCVALSKRTGAQSMTEMELADANGAKIWKADAADREINAMLTVLDVGMMPSRRDGGVSSRA